MMRDLLESGLVIPMLVVALLASMLGYTVTERLSRSPVAQPIRVSVVSLPAAPAPSPTPIPQGGGEVADLGGGTTSGGTGNCPSGCECSGHPGGVVIICR